MNKAQVLQLRNLLYDVVGIVYRTNGPTVRGIVNSIRALSPDMRLGHWDINDTIGVELDLEYGTDLCMVFYNKTTDENLHVEQGFMQYGHDGFLY